MKKLLTCVIICVVILGLYVADVFYMIENNLTDRVFDDSDTLEPNSQIKILAIDEASLEELGRWPWSRDILADVVGRLADAGAKAVWVDTLFTEESIPEHDRQWEEIAASHDNVFLSTYFTFPDTQRMSEGQGISFLAFNEPVFSVDHEQLGHINVIEDDDRVVRKIMLGVEGPDDQMIPAVSVRMANTLLSENEQISWTGGEWKKGETSLPVGNWNDIIFGYYSAPEDEAGEGFDVVPFHRVYDQAIPDQYFQDAVVMIGPYTTAMQDHFYTPVNKKTPMFGVEIHASIVQSLYDDRIYQPVSTAAGAGIIVVLFAFSYLLSNLIKARWAVIVLVLSVVLYTIVLAVVHNQMHLNLPYFYPLLALVAAYIASVVVQYVQETLDKRKVTDLFGRYVSDSVVDEILGTDEEVKVGGVRKDVTLMFVDIRGFTTLSERIEPEEVIQILNEYLDLATKAVFAQEGTIDKFMGDGVMAIFGAPLQFSDHPHRALRSALIMKQQEEMMVKKLEERYGKSVRFGIGINSGPAVIGNVGSEDRLDYTAIGDTVNLSARLESNAKPGQILVSADTYERVKDEFVFEKLDAIKVKGKEKPVQIYGLIEER